MKKGNRFLNWERILDENGRALLLYARQWAGSWANAEDALQEGFVRVFKKGVPNPDGALPMLYQAVRWAAIDQLRSNTRRQAREERAAEEDEKQVALFESDIENQERARQIEEGLKTLPDEQREVVVMKVWGNLKFRQIAEALDIPVGTAASRYRYALEALRSQLDPGVWNER